MKWRERISILSRKRKHIRNVTAEENDRTSPSGSSDAHDRENVEKTLSQIRPVIGPDHKSYYILLRGNEDSFTCIQPAKDVITSLDEVVKNVVNSVKLSKSQGSSLSPYLKTSRSSETRSYRNASKKSIRENVKVNGVGNEVRVNSGIDLDNFCDKKPEERFLGTENVVENVVLNRTVQTINSNHNEVTRTSTLVYPLVQNRLDSNDTVLGTDKQESCVFVPNKKTYSETPAIGVPSAKVLDHSFSQNNVINLKQEPEVQINKDNFSGIDETLLPETDDLVEKTRPITEIRLLAKDGCVLTEESIAEQVKLLIESETLIIGEDAHIVAIRGNAQEVILRISPKETDVSQLLEHHGLKQEVFDLGDDFLPQDDEEEFQEEVNPLSFPDSSLQEEICCNPDMVVNSSNINNNNPERVQYLLSSISPSPHDMFEECDVGKESDLDKVMMQEEEEEEDPLGYCMLDHPSVQDAAAVADQIEVEKLFLNGGDSLLSPNEDIVVFQREDGALVNQDGTPVSTELQYLIASISQPDDQTHLPDGYANHIFLSARP